MKWSYLIDLFFENKKYGTPQDVRDWLKSNKISLLEECVLKTEFCRNNPRNKTHEVVNERAHHLLQSQQITATLFRKYKKGELNRKKSHIAKWVYFVTQTKTTGENARMKK